jgi:hypothetical protein
MRETPTVAPLMALRSRRKAALAPTIGTTFGFETWWRRQKAELVEQRDGSVKIGPP